MAAELDSAKVDEFLMRVVGDLGAAASGALLILGDRLGLYRALAEGGPQNSAELARRTGCSERYLREWLAAQAAAGYVEYDGAAQRFTLPAEHAALLADPQSPLLMTGGFHSVASLYMDEPKVSAAFRSGRGVGWHEHSECLFCGTERFFGPIYRRHLVEHWLPALDGALEKLRRGAQVADVGCGHGLSTALMAQAFPNSKFTGFDYHDGSIERAARQAAELGVKNVEFHVSEAAIFPGQYDLVACFDCLHDMGDPVGAARHVRSALRDDGLFMVVEPQAGDRLEDNLHPLGRLFYSFSTMVCVPASLSQEGAAGLGAQAGPARLTAVLQEAGFSRVRVAASTAGNLILEARG